MVRCVRKETQQTSHTPHEEYYMTHAHLSPCRDTTKQAADKLRYFAWDAAICLCTQACISLLRDKLLLEPISVIVGAQTTKSEEVKIKYKLLVLLSWH